MGLNETTTGTINGSAIVGIRHGQYTGDRQIITADGRAWTDLKGSVPNTLPTGAIIATVQK
jgi:hypothetical protein